MEAVVKQQINGKTPEEVLELTVEGITCSNIEGISDSFSNLTRLSVVNCGLKSLDGLPKLPKLTILLLGDNKLDGKDCITRVVECCPNLQSLSLVGNRFSTLEELQQLVELEKLQGLDLFNCQVTSGENYRDKLFSLLPKLQSLDGFDKSGGEVSPPGEEEEEEEEEDSDEDDGPGLEYLQQDIEDSDNEGADFDPEAEPYPGSDDYNEYDTDEEEDEAEGGDKEDRPGPSKRARLEVPIAEDCDSESD